MKKFALFFIALLAISCSDDDTDSGTGTDLKTVVTSIYGMEGALLDRTVMEFQDNKPSSFRITHPDGQLYRNYDYSYGADGQLKTMKIYNSGQLAVTQEFEYDTQHRLIKWTSADHLDFDDIMGADHVYNYIHNNDNTITQTVEGGSNRTYYLNNAGQVYKIAYQEGYVSQVTYSGNDVLEWAQGSTVGITYFYDDVHPVKGEFRNYMKNQFSGYEANHILYGGHANAVAASDRYITHQVQNNGSTTQYNYEFNAAGYPTRVSTSQNGDEPNVFVDITYQ